MEDLILLEDTLIEYVKPYFKARGFRKKNKRWSKSLSVFTLVFYIQGSCYSKEDYYIRPGIFINALSPTQNVYGHIMTEIPITTIEQILKNTEEFFAKWSDKQYFKQKLIDFIEWECRNPLEKRRAGKVDNIKDPVPAQELFTVSGESKNYILNHF
ncbi:MAG: DUF4304 domain-containing protein [Clostridia bacterium]|nr:DUF4304 domain-containing protein [Clostridia bacterium]